ncbi:hypothetical protein BDD12DRAFT_892103 [Trichophaea hybrida]|nr:hypothetical protein BDD12DRAFT_892103 [Trichophaea hybrida]
MNNLPDAPPLTAISSLLARIHPDEFDDPQFSDDGSSLLSSAPSTFVTLSFAAESSASDTTATTGSTIFKRKKINRISFVFNDANGMEFTSQEGKPRWRCQHCPHGRTAQTFAELGTKNMIKHLRDIHLIDTDGPMNSDYAVNQRIDHAFRKAKQRIQFNLDMFKQLPL